LLLTIADRARAPIFGSPAKRVRYIVDGAEGVDELVAAVHAAPPGLAITAYVEIVSQARARRHLAAQTPKREPIAEWREVPVGEPADPDFNLAQVRAARDALRSRADGAQACETTTGGGA
jgi:hypothetical protein